MITTVSTVKDDPDRVQRWIDRNLAAGVDRMIVFLDDMDPPRPLEPRGDQQERVVAVNAQDWWQDARPDHLNSRQRINANAGLTAVNRVDPRGWVFHIDGDEVLDLDKERLLALPPETFAVQLSPLEAVSQWVWPDDDGIRFKRPLTQEELDLLLLLRVIERPENSSYFRGHMSGKAGLRAGTHAWLGIHRVFDDDMNAVPALAGDWLRLLHYESHTFAEFVRKWANLVASGPPVAARRNRGQLGSAMRADLWNRLSFDTADALRRELFARTTLDDLDGLEDLGLLESAAHRGNSACVDVDDLCLDDLASEMTRLSLQDKEDFRLHKSAPDDASL